MSEKTTRCARDLFVMLSIFKSLFIDGWNFKLHLNEKVKILRAAHAAGSV